MSPLISVQPLLTLNTNPCQHPFPLSLFSLDGKPFAPVEAPCYMTDTDLTSVTLYWGYAPVPSYAPLLGYNIKFLSQNNLSRILPIETNDNETTFKLLSLTPGTNYTVVIQGRNSYGLGELSEPLIVSTMKGAPPPPPTQVIADLEKTDGFNIEVTVSWMVRI